MLGRLAMLVFATAVVAERVNGGESPLAHWGLIAPGVLLSQAPLWLKAADVLLLADGLGFLSRLGTRQDNDTY